MVDFFIRILYPLFSFLIFVIVAHNGRFFVVLPQVCHLFISLLQNAKIRIKLFTRTLPVRRPGERHAVLAKIGQYKTEAIKGKIRQRQNPVSQNGTSKELKKLPSKKANRQAIASSFLVVFNKISARK